MTSAWDTDKKRTAKDQANWSNLSGIQVIVFASVAVIGGLLLTACLCAFCTVFLFKYLQRNNPNGRPSQRCHDPQVPICCVSCNVSQKEGCLAKSDCSDCNADILYEEPLTLSPPPALPPLMPVRKEFFDDKLDVGLYISETESSRSSNVSSQSSGSLASNKSGNFPSEASTPSDSSEGDEYVLPEFQGDEKLCSSVYNISDHDYGNAGIIRMSMLPRSVSFSRLHIQNTMTETEFPLPPLPVQMKSKQIQRLQSGKRYSCMKRRESIHLLTN